MKTFLKTAALALVLAPVMAFASEEVDVKITGMTCGSCSAKVEKELKALNMIEKDAYESNSPAITRSSKLRKTTRRLKTQSEQLLKKLATKSQALN